MSQKVFHWYELCSYNRHPREKNIMQLNRIIMVVALSASLVGVASARLPRNSYITKPTPSKESFLKLIKSDKVVMDRYMRHFSMNRDEVIDYMSKIKMSKLNQGGLYTVYNVPATTGELRSKLLKMRKGEPIWVDQFGQPLMVVICGNPMTRGPKNVVAYDKPATNPILADVAPAPVRMGEEVISTSEPAPIEPDKSVAAYEPAMPEVTAVTPEGPNVVPTVIQGGAVSRNNLGAFLLGIPLLAIPTLNKGDRNPVPEPASALVLAAGAGLFIARRRK